MLKNGRNIIYEALSDFKKAESLVISSIGHRPMAGMIR